jgi:hypothetical protein
LSLYETARKPRSPKARHAAPSATSSGAILPARTGSASTAPNIDFRGKAVGSILSTNSKSSTDNMSILEMIRKKKLGTEDDFDRQMSKAITRDVAFQNDLDYMDENANLLSSKKASKKNKLHENTSGEKKRKVNLEEYVRQQKALEKCNVCFREGVLPQVPIVSIGVKAYLALVPYHSVATCQIIPVDHMISTLDGDDIFWDEIRVRILLIFH